MKKLSFILLFLFISTLLICADETISSTQNSTYEDQMLEKKINDIVEKRLKEKEAENLKNSKKESSKEKKDKKTGINQTKDRDEDNQYDEEKRNKKDSDNSESEKKDKKNEDLTENKGNKKNIETEENNKEIIKKDNKIELFGKKIFNIENTETMPSEISAGKDYVLSAGDYIRIALWSDNMSLGKDGIVDVKIAANGVVSLPDLGAFTLRGKTIEEAENELAVKGLRKLKDFKVRISLIQMRSINVFVLGEVNMPGSFTLSPMSGVMAAIYKAGGITDHSSLRNIKILRDGKTIVVDLYDYLLKGENKVSVKLAEGDTIFIPASSDCVTIIGNVIREGIYELKGKTTLKEVVEMAGGATPDAFINEINIKRKANSKLEIVTVKDMNAFEIMAGDEIELGGKDSRYTNGVLIKGNVVRPGVYEIKSGEKFKDLLAKAGGFKPETFISKIDLVRVKEDLSLVKNSFDAGKENPELKGEDTITVYSITDAVARKMARVDGEVKKAGSYEIYENSRVSDLLFNAGGVKEETAFFGRADIIRIDEDGSLKVIKVELGKILAGNKEADISLENYDTLKIFSLKDSKLSSQIYVYGEVREPDEYEYFEGMTLSDAIFYAKGTKISADKANIEVVRSSVEGGGVSSIKVNINENTNFILKEFDQIFVRKIPNWEEKKIIKVKGYVQYPGEYAVSNNETLNDIINRAGGYKAGAFPDGIKFYRTHNFKEELSMMNMKFEEDVLNRERVLVTNLDFDRKKNHFIQNVILKDGDEIEIPETSNVVKVMGEVYMPGMVVYQKGKDLDYYVNGTGGFTDKAYVKKAFVVKYNGKTEKNGWFSKVKLEAGDTVIVPKDDRVKKSFWEIVGATVDFVAKLATTFAVIHSVTN